MKTRPLAVETAPSMRPSREVTVLVRQGIHPECFFKMRFYNSSKTTEIRDIVSQWTRITGLRFDLMKCLDDSASEGYYAFRVEHPMDNRSAVYFIWATPEHTPDVRCDGCAPAPLT